MDWFLPVLILSILLLAFLWWYEFHVMRGREVTLYLVTLFGVRMEYLRRRQQKLAAIANETAEWISNEVDRVYGHSDDPSGKMFMEYSNLFTNLAVLDATNLDQLTARQELLQHKRPFRAAVIQQIVEDLGKDMTFNTNAIEGNPLTARETTIILSGFSVGRGRKLRDVFDILGHHKAFEEMLQLVLTKSEITMDHLKRLHKMVLFESDDGGILRSGREIAMISGVKTLFAPPWEVENLVREFLRWLSRSMTDNVHPFLLAVSCHSIFARIHPFRDGNGRMARLLMNYVLLRTGYPALIVLNSKKTQYSNAIKQWQKDDPEPLTHFMLEMLKMTFAVYFQALNIKEKLD